MTPAPGPAGDEALAIGIAYVRLHVPGRDASTLGPDVDVVETYDGFVLARVSAATLARLARRGITFVPEDPFALHVNGYAFDTRSPVRVPPALTASADNEGRGYYVVQFIGPLKETWRWRVEGRGAEVVGYVPNNAYLLRAAPDAVAEIAAFREVQWVGPYHPAFRIAPELLAADGPVAVKVITFGGEPVTATVAALNKMGLRVVGRGGTGEGLLAWRQFDDFGLVRARVDARLLASIARLPAVRYVEPDLEMALANQNSQFVLQTNASSGLSPGARRLWDLGLRGEGETIALSDTGIDYDHNQFRHTATQVTIGDVYNVTDFARRKLVRYFPMSGFRGVDPFTGGDPNAIKDAPDGVCGTGHGTSTSGAAGGNDTGIAPDSPNDGMAPSAKLIMMDIGTIAACTDTLSYLPDNFDDLFGPPYQAGARIFSNSWGSPSSDYTLEARMVDRFVRDRPDALILFANGNNPPNPSVGSPATSKNGVGVAGAASWNARDTMGASSRGPTADGRRKPDFTTIFSTVFPGGTAASDGLLTTLNSGDAGFAGTSYATPLAAGMAALARQYFQEGWYPHGVRGGAVLSPSAALVKATLAAGSVQMTGPGSCLVGDARYPNNAQGWGRLWLDEALYVSGDAKKLFVVDHRAGIETGTTLEYTVRVASPAGGLRAFLAWSDPPALEGANPALVNNLDLEVVSPANVAYKGNVPGTCAEGETVAGGTFDTRNNLEGVVRRGPATGDWRIRVIASSIPVGPQPFALVVLGALDQTVGIVETDRTTYSEADTVRIQVTDSDAAGPVTVRVTSNTEAAGEVVTLTAAGPSLWRGTIPTAYAVPAADGRLQVGDGDAIVVTYGDASPSRVATAFARVEISGPAISNVRATDITNAAATIMWTTDRPANGTVFYGTTTTLGAVASDPARRTLHALTLTGLATGTLYYFDVASGRAGHTVRDSNGGRHYVFQTTEKAGVLLVLGDGSFPSDRVSMYRDALAAGGWTWNEWEVALAGDPPLATMQTYLVVVWQVGLEQYPPISDSQLTLLRAYVDGGGRIAIGGHDIGWASCDVASAFRTVPRCEFVRSVMKADYLVDPPTWSQQVGVAADPISGAYAPGGVPGPQPYVPHRDGGAGDEVAARNAGGLAEFAWRTNTGSANPDDGVRWISSAPNGTANPACVWCGTPSRVVSLFFEFTGINFAAGTPSDAARTDILGKTLVWLLGRIVPTVNVLAPNGGEIIGTNALTVSWSRSSPIAIASQEVWYSRDGGGSWGFVQSPPPANTSTVVDISNVTAWPNGDQYLIRVVATDAGTPPFKGQDDSDGTFRVNRAGGNVDGPLVRPGSLRVNPNPAWSGSNVTVQATVDDTLRGASAISAAELFVANAPPDPLQFGSGTAMSPSDGAFNTPAEDVRATIVGAWPVGSTQTVWVHGRDVEGIWGPLANLSFLVILEPPPNPPPNVHARLVGPSAETVRISWTIPPGPSVARFQVYVRPSYDPGKAGYALLQDNIPATNTSFDHVNAGSGDASHYFYYVRAVNAAGGADSVDQAAKFVQSLAAGWNLVSVPVTLQDASLLSALQTLNWRTARTYVASDSADPWKAWNTAKNDGDLRTASLGTALWVDVPAPDDFTVAGQVPARHTITLVTGWNFIGYASFVVRTAGASFAGLPVTLLEGFAPTPPYHLRRMALTESLEPGRGYWVYVTAGGAWTVTN